MLVEDWTERIKEASEALLDAPKGTHKSTKAKIFEHVLSLTEQANEWSEYVGERKRWKMPESLDALGAVLAEERKRQAAKDAREKAKREREYKIKALETAKENAKTISEWIAGGDVRVPYQVRECYLRVERFNTYKCGDQGYGETCTCGSPVFELGELELVTSQGARMPLEHARKALVLIRAVVARGERWERNGHQIRLGHYQIDVIEPDGTVRAGCHTVTYAEIERVAPEIERAVLEREVTGQ